MRKIELNSKNTGMGLKKIFVALAAMAVMAPAVYGWSAEDRKNCDELAARTEKGFEDMLRYSERHYSQFNYKGWELWQIEVPKMLREVAATGQVNLSSPSGFSALQAACYYADVELAKALIENGADVNLRPMGWKGYGFPGDTPIALLVRGLTPETAEARVEIARLLIEKGANPDAVMMDWVWGASAPVVPFCYLTGEEGANAMRMALIEGAGQNLRNRARTWEFNWAWYTPELIRTLLEGGVSPNRSVGEKGATLLYWLVRRGDAELVQLALDKGASTKASDQMKHYLGDYLFALPVGAEDSAENTLKIANMLVKAKANLKATHEGKSLYAYYGQFDTPAAQALLKFFAGKGIRK